MAILERNVLPILVAAEVIHLGEVALQLFKRDAPSHIRIAKLIPEIEICALEQFDVNRLEMKEEGHLGLQVCVWIINFDGFCLICRLVDLIDFVR